MITLTLFSLHVQIYKLYNVANVLLELVVMRTDGKSFFVPVITLNHLE